MQQECIPELENSLERPTTVSLRVVPLSQDTNSLERLITMADAAMYRSKKMVKNKVSVFVDP